jgi:REP element-mobilizing transposase RayT
MVRGIERRSIFKTDTDQRDLLDRISRTLTKTRTPCYAYAVMSNHCHMLLQTGATSISKVMQSLLTGYAVSYNLRHNRSGKLYQNRYKSVLCDKEEYLLQLVRYIHLNPVRVNLVGSLAELDQSPLTGHSILMGKRKTEKPKEGEEPETFDWLATEEILSRFGASTTKARQAYREFIREDMDNPAPADLSGGGLIRSMGGIWEAVKASRDTKRKKEMADERILGSGDFVEAALKHAEEQEAKVSQLQKEGWDFQKTLNRAAQAVGTSPESLQHRSRKKEVSEGRALLSKWLVEDLGYGQKDLAIELGISQAAVSKLVIRGRGVENKLGTVLGGR